MVGKALSIVLTLVVVIQAERIYTPPTITQQRPSPPTYAQAANPNKNVAPPRTNPVQIPVQVQPAPKSGTGQFLPQNLTFIVSAKNLKNSGVDPQIKVSKAGKNGTYEVLGKTEGLDNNANPEFLKVFWIIWNKGTQQKLKFEVRDVDNFRRDDPLGQAVIDLDEYVLRGEKWNVTLQNGTGSILIQKTTPVKFRLYGRGLPNADTVGKSDPYVECFWSTGSNGKKIKFAQTAVLDNNEDPDWNQTFEFANFIRGTDQYWTFKVSDSDPTGSDLLGEAIVEVDSFVAKRQTKIVTLANKKSTTARLGITPA